MFGLINNVYDQRKNCHDSISLSNRYSLTIGLTVISYCLFRRRAFRKTAYAFVGWTWFCCPEWGVSYFKPKKTISDLMSETDQNSEEQHPVDSMKVLTTNDATATADATSKVLNKASAAQHVEDLKEEAASLLKEKRELEASAPSVLPEEDEHTRKH